MAVLAHPVVVIATPRVMVLLHLQDAQAARQAAQVDAPVDVVAVVPILVVTDVLAVAQGHAQVAVQERLKVTPVTVVKEIVIVRVGQLARNIVLTTAKVIVMLYVPVIVLSNVKVDAMAHAKECAILVVQVPAKDNVNILVKVDYIIN